MGPSIPPLPQLCRSRQVTDGFIDEAETVRLRTKVAAE
jgi:hypothetical protein